MFRPVSQVSSPAAIARHLLSAILHRASGPIRYGGLEFRLEAGVLLGLAANGAQAAEPMARALSNRLKREKEPSSIAAGIHALLSALAEVWSSPESIERTLRDSSLYLQPAERAPSGVIASWLDTASEPYRLRDVNPSRAAVALSAGLVHVAPHPSNPPRHLPLCTPSREGPVQRALRLVHELDSPHSGAVLLREHLEESESQEAHWWSWLGDIHFRGADGKGAISAYERASVSEAPSSLLLSSWARASLLTPNPTDLENWFERCAPHWTEEPQLRTLAFWIARWHRRGSLARRAVLEGSHRDLDLWAEALQLWPDDPEVTERYAADLALRDGPASAALVLAELTPRLLDPADRARVGLLSAEYAASAGWSAWEVAMYDYVSGQTPELDFSHDVTDSTAHPAPEEPSELMSDSRDSIEMIAYQLDPTAPDPEALEALAAYAKGELGNAERVADALERAARRASDGRLQAKLYQSLAELSLDRLEQPRRALWALERAGHTGGAALSRQAHVEARATEAMQKRPGNERQLAALQRRSPDDYPEAIAYYEAAVKSDPNDTVAYRSLERLYRILGDDERADSMLDRQVHVASSDVERRALERRVHARRALSRAAKHTKRNPDAHAATLLPPGKDALRYGQRRTHDESTPPHAAAALGAIKALHEAPSANAYLAFAARFGGSTGLFRAALQLAYADQAEPDAQAVIGAWCDRHVHDLGAYRQQLRDALDRALPEAMIRAAEELLALPLLHHTVPELQECWEQSAAARRTIEGALVERLGLHFPLALDGCARREWSLFTADQASRESTLLELYHRYLADADMEHAAWALQRLSATPE